MKTTHSLSENSRSRCVRNGGSAIVITLSILVLVTVLAVGLFSVLMTERTTSNGAFEASRARALNQLAADHAISLIRQATAGANGTFWSSQPGAITVFNANGTVKSTTLLYSGTSLTTGTNAVELNQPTFAGNYPIASLNSVRDPNNPGSHPGTPPSIQAPWVNILKDPQVAASGTNPIIGRYAFWVDDESAKLNINTADGTVKNGANGAIGASSFGPGTPVEMSLSALKVNDVYIDDTNNGAIMSGTLATGIAQRTGVRPVLNNPNPVTLFNDPSEILQVAGTASTVYADNNFSITTHNRSPELNIFGEPKINLMITGTNYGDIKWLPLNAMLGAYAYSGSSNFLNPCWTSGTQLIGEPLGFGSYYNSNPALSYSISMLVGTNGAPIVGNDPVDFTKVPLSQIYPATLNQASGTGSAISVLGQLPRYSIATPAGGAYSGSLPQYFTDPAQTNYLTPGNTFNGVCYRIAQYLSGTNSQGQAITWPTFPGSGSTGFKGKYTPRQIDSITLQIMDVMGGMFADHYRHEKLLSITNGAFVTPATYQQTVGHGSGPHVNEVVFKFTASPGSPAVAATGTSPAIPIGPDQLTMEVYVQWYVPKEYKEQNDMVFPYAGGGGGWAYGCGGNTGYWLNWEDAQCTTQIPSGTSFATVPCIPTPKPGPLGGYWMDNMLTVTDGTSATSGSSVLDLMGNNPSYTDPDQAKAQYCAHTTGTIGGKIVYLGSGPVKGADFAPILQLNNFLIPSLSISGTNQYSGERAGYYVCTRSSYYNVPYDMKPGLSGTAGGNGIWITGGVALWTHWESGPTPIEVVPLDSLHGQLNSTGYNSLVTPPALGPVLTPTMNDGVMASGTLTDPVRKKVLDAVIPIPPIHLAMGSNQSSWTATVVMQVDDPVVNKFPGDWYQGTTPTLPMTSSVAVYRDNLREDPNYFKPSTPLRPNIPPGATTHAGAPAGFQSGNKGDPSGYWWPEQSVLIPKSQRFPSIGYLQYIHTGIMPDIKTESDAKASNRYGDNTPDIRMLHGTPFRLLNFSPSTDASQQTYGGTSYPDWAMLDLFTVPAAFQPMDPSRPLDVSGCPPPIQLTWGGATTGRLNPNSAIAPFNTSGAQVFSRTTPLEGILKNLQTSTSYTGQTQNFNTLDNISMDGTPQNDYSVLAQAIDSYVATLTTNGVKRPLMMAAEICNVPEVANFLYDSNTTGKCSTPGNYSATFTRNSRSRNDLVKQIVGNLSTQSNTFTVWTVSQTLDKKGKPAAESRMKFVVERYLDYGVAGIPGNVNTATAGAGTDGVVGTPDDKVDYDQTATGFTQGGAPSPIYHPRMSYPLHYRYRILSASQVND